MLIDGVSKLKSSHKEKITNFMDCWGRVRLKQDPCWIQSDCYNTDYYYYYYYWDNENESSERPTSTWCDQEEVQRLHKAAAQFIGLFITGWWWWWWRQKIRYSLDYVSSCMCCRCPLSRSYHYISYMILLFSFLILQLHCSLSFIFWHHQVLLSCYCSRTHTNTHIKCKRIHRMKSCHFSWTSLSVYRWV